MTEQQTTAQAVERAISLAQDAVKADEAGDIDDAIRLYLQSVELIKYGLQVQREEEVVDNTVLHKYQKLYSDRIAELSRSLINSHEPPLLAANSSGGGSSGLGSGAGDAAARTPASPGGSGASGAVVAASPGGASASFFLFDEPELRSATPPNPAPSGPDEWRRPFWLMRILRTSMLHGGYVSSDGRVYVPRRVWVQKGARFTAMAAKADCAQCLMAELARVKAVDHTQPEAVLPELTRLSETLDALQNSLARLLPYVPEPRGAGEGASNAMSKLTERFKGLAKTLDKTAARLGALPTKCADPTEYVSSLVGLFDAAAFLEAWMEHYMKLAFQHTDIYEKLHRCAAFLYEVVCAFVIQDLDALVTRHMRKAAAGFIKATD